MMFDTVSSSSCREKCLDILTAFQGDEDNEVHECRCHLNFPAVRPKSKQRGADQEQRDQRRQADWKDRWLKREYLT